MQVDIVQCIPLGLGGVAEADILEINGAVLHLGHGILRGDQVGLLVQQLSAAAHGGPGHNQHHEHHGQHHQAGKNLGGVGKHGAELAGGQTGPGDIAGGNDQFGTEPGNGQHTAVDTQLHHRVVQRQNVLCLAEQAVDFPGNAGEFLNFPVLPDEALHHPDAVDILLHHVVQAVIGFEHLVENFEHHRNQPNQHQRQQGQGHAVHQA